jgi:type I restriction enzyme, S subunit
MRSELSLSEACELIVDCPHRTAPEATEAFAYAVGTKAINHGRISFNNARPVDQETYASWIARAMPQEGDIILCREAPVGPVARVPKYPLVCLGQRTVLLRPNRETVDPRFLMYALLAPPTQSALREVSEGSTVPHLNVADIRRFLVSVPSLDEQRRVAYVLAALDKKIDSNRRLARLLEQMAAAAFRAQFVDFVGIDEFEDSDLGPIPRGWQVGTLADIAELHKGQVKPTDAPDALFEHFSIPAFDAGNGASIELGRTILSSKTTVPGPESVLVSKLNPATKRIWWPQPCNVDAAICSSEFLVLLPRPGVPTSYLYAVASSDERFYGELLSNVTGTTGSRQRVRPAAAMSCRVIVPSAPSLEVWDSFSKPLYDHAHMLIAECRELAGIRDSLLPKLISGQIRVPVLADPGEMIEPLVDEAA